MSCLRAVAFGAWLASDYPDLDGAVGEPVARDRARVAEGSSVAAQVARGGRPAAVRVPVAIVSGAAREEIEPVLAAAGLGPLVTAIVSADEVVRGRPDPEGYERALALLGVEAGDALAVEDTEADIAAARAADVRCVAVAGTLARARLAAAEEVVEAIDRPLLERLLAPA